MLRLLAPVTLGASDCSHHDTHTHTQLVQHTTQNTAPQSVCGPRSVRTHTGHRCAVLLSAQACSTPAAHHLSPAGSACRSSPQHSAACSSIVTAASASGQTDRQTRLHAAAQAATAQLRPPRYLANLPPPSPPLLLPFCCCCCSPQPLPPLLPWPCSRSRM